MAINIKELKPDDIGRLVTYSDFSGVVETGIIKSWNESFVFVVYYARKGGSTNCEKLRNFQNYTAASTNPKDLEFVKKIK